MSEWKERLKRKKERKFKRIWSKKKKKTIVEKKIDVKIEMLLVGGSGGSLMVVTVCGSRNFPRRQVLDRYNATNLIFDFNAFSLWSKSESIQELRGSLVLTEAVGKEKSSVGVRRQRWAKKSDSYDHRGWGRSLRRGYVHLLTPSLFSFYPFFSTFFLSFISVSSYHILSFCLPVRICWW